MSQPEFKYQISFESPSIKSDVPEEQKARESAEVAHTYAKKVLGNDSTTDRTATDKPSSTMNNAEDPVPSTNNVKGHNEEKPSEEKEKESEDAKAVQEDFVLTPVMTVTKEEVAFTKGDVKLQKVSVTEDISVRFQHLLRKQKLPGKTVVTEVQTFEYKY